MQRHQTSKLKFNFAFSSAALQVHVQYCTGGWGCGVWGCGCGGVGVRRVGVGVRRVG